jgi:hypothetical protein
MTAVSKTYPRTVAHDRMDRGYASPLPPYPPGGIYIMIVPYNPRVGGDPEKVLKLVFPAACRGTLVSAIALDCAPSGLIKKTVKSSNYTLGGLEAGLLLIEIPPDIIAL